MASIESQLALVQAQLELEKQKNQNYAAKEAAALAAERANDVDISLIKPGMSLEDYQKVGAAIKRVLHQHDVRSGRFS